MKKVDMLFELSHPARISMIRLAAARPVWHRDFMQASGLPPSEVTRHSKRLIHNGFIKRNRDGSFEITRLGCIMMNRLDDFEFISFHGSYFEHHDVSDIPTGFDMFQMLRKCQLLNETMSTVNAILRINAESRDFINCIMDEFNDAFVSIQIEKLGSGLAINMLTRPGIRIPSEYIENRNMGIIMRKIQKVPFFLIGSEREALICLKESGGRMDYSMAFISSDSRFLEWCGELFEHYWVRGKDLGL